MYRDPIQGHKVCCGKRWTSFCPIVHRSPCWRWCAAFCFSLSITSAMKRKSLGVGSSQMAKRFPKRGEVVPSFSRRGPSLPLLCVYPIYGELVFVSAQLSSTFRLLPFRFP